MAVAIIVLGKEVRILELDYSSHCQLDFSLTFFPQNSPKYLACINSEQELQLRYKMHTALDFIEEKLSVSGKSSNDVRELYLGQLYAAEDYKLYPFVPLLFVPTPDRLKVEEVPP